MFVAVCLHVMHLTASKMACSFDWVFLPASMIWLAYKTRQQADSGKEHSDMRHQDRQYSTLILIRNRTHL